MVPMARIQNYRPKRAPETRAATCSARRSARASAWSSDVVIRCIKIGCCSATNLTSSLLCPCAKHPGEPSCFCCRSFCRNPRPPPSLCTSNFYLSRTLSVNSPLPRFNPIATKTPASRCASPARRPRMSPVSSASQTHSLPISRPNSFCRRLITSRPSADRCSASLEAPLAGRSILPEGTVFPASGAFHVRSVQGAACFSRPRPVNLG